MSRGPQCQGGPNGSAPGATPDNGTERAACCGAVTVAFPLTFMIIGLVGNLMALVLVVRCYRAKENQQKRSFLLCIFSLALTDLLGQLLISPIVITVYLADRSWDTIDPTHNLCIFFGFNMTVFGLCPLFIASVMAVERTLAIRTPHWYASHMNTRVTTVVMLGICLFVCAFGLLPVIGLGEYTVQWPGTWCFVSTSNSQLTRNLVFTSIFALLGLLSLMVTVVCNLVTVQAMVSRCRSKAPVSRSSKQWGRITAETLIQLLGISCILLVCWAPLLIMMLKMIFTHTSLEHCKGFPLDTQNPDLQEICSVFLTAVRLASLNQLLDPWVYLLFRNFLLEKLCQLASAVSKCSTNQWKERSIALTEDNRHTEA
ncbi:PE2R3 protein, partial [Alopecoenas beccarii]|nr:PE2R3 protein [Alopecoenas beccarii]